MSPVWNDVFSFLAYLGEFTLVEHDEQARLAYGKRKEKALATSGGMLEPQRR